MLWYAGYMPRHSPVVLRVALCLVAVVSGAACGGGRSAPVEPVVTATPAATGGEPTHRELAYADAARTFDLYLPRDARPAPVAIWLHGGSWIAGDKRPLPLALFRLRDRGFAVASVNYRLTGLTSHPAQLHDVKGAVRWLRAHAPEYGLDPARMYFVGFSAGAHLASLAALTAGDPASEGDVGGNRNQSSAVGGVVGIAGPSDLLRLAGECTGCEISPEFVALGCSFLLCGDLGRAASSITHAHRGAPPFLLLHGDADRLVPPEQARLLDAALRAVGADSRLVLTPGGAHGLLDAAAEREAQAFLLRLAGLPR